MCEAQAIDFYSTPEFFIEKIKTECAGNGNVRIFVYGKRGGSLVPLYSAVASATDMIDFAHQITEAAALAVQVERTKLGIVAH